VKSWVRQIRLGGYCKEWASMKWHMLSLKKWCLKFIGACQCAFRVFIGVMQSSSLVGTVSTTRGNLGWGGVHISQLVGNLGWARISVKAAL
jgi:hypothetical protein